MSKLLIHGRDDGLVVPKMHQFRPKPRAARRSLCLGIGALLNADGTVSWQDEEWMPNALMDEGEQSMLNVYLKEAANPSKYLCLINGGTTAPTETDTMAYLGGSAGANETKVPAASGYNRQQITGTTDWTDDGLQGGDYRFSASEKTFGPASGSSWTVTHAGLVTALTGQIAGSGKFLLFIALSASTTIAVNQSFKYIIRWTQQ